MQADRYVRSVAIRTYVIDPGQLGQGSESLVFADRVLLLYIRGTRV